MTFLNYLKAGYPCIWVQTHEEERAIETLSKEAPEYKTFSWDIVSGMRDYETSQFTVMGDPIKPLQASLPESSVLFIKDAHKFIENLEYYRTVKNLIPVLKGSGKHLVFISPILKIPIELEKDITVYQFNLPTGKELLDLANKMITDNELTFKADENAVTAAVGLTLGEAENSFALSVIEKKKYDKGIIEKEKLQAVKKSGLMEIYPAVPESELGGLDNLKKYLHSRREGFTNPALAQAKPKGILLMGRPGTGKSLAAKVVASILDLPLVRLDFSSLKSSLVGDSEKRLRQALQVIDALHGSVVWLEEVEKSVSGVQSSGRTDGGTTSAMFGTLLTWMQESESPHYLVGTVNDIDELLSVSQGAFIRRFDDLFYVDAPDEEERKSIIAIMNRRYKTAIPKNMAAKTAGWTGAEIEKFVRASVYDGVETAFSNIKPISEQNKTAINKAKDWATINCRWANTRLANNETTKKARRVNV